ncbi:phosphate-starvation-inducible PsiE family protein [Calditrichota bacterium LG25]
MIEPKRDFITKSYVAFEYFIYLIVSILLVITIGLLVYNSVLVIGKTVETSNFIRGVLKLIDRVLLIIMVVEILYTVKVSIQSHKLSPAPFFIIGLIASIRRILIISVEGAYLPEKFNHHMIEMGVLGVIIIIFVFSLILFKKYEM